MTLFLVMLMATIYSVPVIMSYYEPARQSTWLWPVSISCALLADVLWIYLVKQINHNDKIAYWSFIWDLTYNLIIFIVPIFVFQVKMSPLSYAGITIMFIGGILLKVGAMQH